MARRETAGLDAFERIDCENATCSLEDRPLQEQLCGFLVFQPFHDLADVLGAVARADQQGVWVSTTTRSRTRSAATNFLGLQRKLPWASSAVNLAGRNIFAGLSREQFVDGGPGADVAPADFGGEDEDGLRRPDRGGAARGWRSPRKYFRVADRSARSVRRSAACRWCRPGASGRRAFSAGDARDCRETSRRARKTCRRSRDSGRRRRIPARCGSDGFSVKRRTAKDREAICVALLRPRVRCSRSRFRAASAECPGRRAAGRCATAARRARSAILRRLAR